MRQLLTVAGGKHSLEISGTVSLHELLFGSQEDVRLKPEDRAHFRIITAQSHMRSYINHLPPSFLLLT